MQTPGFAGLSGPGSSGFAMPGLREGVSSMRASGIKVSIVIPVYNSETYIEACLDSMLAQTLRDIEIIVINDCSSDSSSSICERYAASDPRVRVMHNDGNIGEGLSRNRGIEAARGTYIGFADADDYVDPDFYEKLFCAAQTNDADIAKAGRIKVFPDGRMERQEKLNKKIQHGLKTGASLCAFFHYEHTTALFRAEKLITTEVIRYPNIKISPDVAFLIKATYFMRKIVFVENTYYYYRQHAQSVSSTKDRGYYDDILECFRLCLGFLNERSISSMDYNLVFYARSRALISRYRDMQKNNDLADYEQEFLQNFFRALQLYALIDITKIEHIVAALSHERPDMRTLTGNEKDRSMVGRLKRLIGRP